MTGIDRVTPPGGSAHPRQPAAYGRAHAARELADGMLDGFARLAARLFDAPMAAIVLTGPGGQAVAGRHGWPAGGETAALALAADANVG